MMRQNQHQDLIRPDQTSSKANAYENPNQQEMYQCTWDDWDVLFTQCMSIDPLEQGQEEEDAENGERPKVLRDPGQPSQKEREEHEATHTCHFARGAHTAFGERRETPSRKISVPKCHAQVFPGYTLTTVSSPKSRRTTREKQKELL